MIAFRRVLKRFWLPVILRSWPLAQLWYRAWGLTLEGRPGDEVWYFAFGANMNDSVFLGRCKMTPLEWRVGRAPDYRLRLTSTAGRAGCPPRPTSRPRPAMRSGAFSTA